MAYDKLEVLLENKLSCPSTLAWYQPTNVKQSKQIIVFATNLTTFKQ